MKEFLWKVDDYKKEIKEGDDVSYNGAMQVIATLNDDSEEASKFACPNEIRNLNPVLVKWNENNKTFMCWIPEAALEKIS